MRAQIVSMLWRDPPTPGNRLRRLRRRRGGHGQEIADRLEKYFGRLQLRYVRATRDDQKTRLRQAGRQFVDAIRGAHQ